MHKEWIKDQQVVQVNRLDPKSFLKRYRSQEELEKCQSSFNVSLNGKWKFEYVESLEEASEDFFKEDYDVSSWDDINVPGHMQMQGYGTPMYVNQQYPWAAREQLLPGDVPHWNPTGSYVKEVELSEADLTEKIIINFHGVESSFALWVNGTFVGYSEDAFTPSQFDITDLVKVGKNRIAAQVYRFTSESWLDDQDFWRFSGIFRDVELIFIPKVHLEDLKVLTPCFENYTKASVDVECTVTADADVTLSLYRKDALVEEKTISGNGNLATSFELENPDLWSAEHPNLYELVITVKKDNQVIEVVTQHVGIREFKLIDGLMCINGKRIVFHGVNRHEFSAKTGRVMTYEETKKDIQIMKDYNINALRTSHYPNHTYVYDLCDELGLYCIDETNLESHGTWQGYFDLEHIAPGNDESWLKAILDRANSMYERDKNHPSIIMWSLGNESLGGKVIWEESEFLRSKDTSRLIHYESVFQEELLYKTRSYPATSDIESQMYTPAKGVEKFIAERPEKPFILCEYSHAMGNSNGGLFKYIELEKRIPKYQGGFLWDFVDQALYDEKGILRYGGDFRERPSDYDFCGDGIVFADRGITPKMQEIKYCYQYVDMKINESTIDFTNTYLFTNLKDFQIKIELGKDGQIIDTKETSIECAPGESVSIGNPFKVDGNGQYYVIVRIYDGDFEVAHEQKVYENKQEEVHAAKDIQIIEDYLNIGVVGDDFRIIFSKSKGLTSYKIGDEEMIRLMPRPNFFRPQTNNDVENQHGYRYAKWLPASMYSVLKYVKTEKAAQTCKVYYEYQLPDVSEEKVYLVYTAYGDGEIVVDMDYMPTDSYMPMPAFGMMFNLYKEYDQVEYFGFGPDENYIDRNKGALLGNYSYNVMDNVTPYLYPQECGNRTNVYQAKISNGKNAFVVKGNAIEFSALPYTPFEIENAKHVDEFPVPYQTVLCVNEKQMGVGGDDTWGAKVLDEFLLSNKEKHHFHISIKAE